MIYDVIWNKLFLDMAVYGFSIFLGFIPITIYILIFIMLITFKNDGKLYFDAMFSGSMAVYLALYYVAFNYTEHSEVGATRDLFTCMMVVMLIFAFLVSSLGYLLAGAVWRNVKSANLRTRGSNEGSKEGLPKSVTFSTDRTEAEQDRYLQQTRKYIAIFVILTSIVLPVLYIIIDIFKEGDADIVTEGHRCWVGGSEVLMYIVFYIPVIIFLVSTLFCLISNGHNNFGVHFYSGKTENSLLINIQLRVILVAGLGLWWLIEIPTLTRHSQSAIQHMNGVINIPLSFLAFYVMVYQAPEVVHLWDKQLPIGRRVKEGVHSRWNKITTYSLKHHKSDLSRSRNNSFNKTVESPGSIDDLCDDDGMYDISLGEIGVNNYSNESQVKCVIYENKAAEIEPSQETAHEGLGIDVSDEDVCVQMHVKSEKKIHEISGIEDPIEEACVQEDDEDFEYSEDDESPEYCFPEESDGTLTETSPV